MADAGGALPRLEPYDVSPSSPVESPYTADERQQLFWNETAPETCRVFVGSTLYQVIR